MAVKVDGENVSNAAVETDKTVSTSTQTKKQHASSHVEETELERVQKLCEEAKASASRLEAETNAILDGVIKDAEANAASVEPTAATISGGSSSSSDSNIGWWLAGAAVAAAALYGGYQFFSEGESDIVLLDNMDECL